MSGTRNTQTSYCINVYRNDSPTLPVKEVYNSSPQYALALFEEYYFKNRKQNNIHSAEVLDEYTGEVVCYFVGDEINK